ncbi:MAG: hypothetical protein HYR51_05670 [Candidatus Rokubacteria bacterium]|nr:hypothetical protein [Candidatus Rokubacteria bacterium]
MTDTSQLIRGLEGVVAAQTELCDLDGANGRLAYRGYDIDELARPATFEDVCHVRWYGELPKSGQLDQLTLALIAARAIPDALVEAFRLMPRDTDPMRVLQASVAILGMHDPDATDNSRAANLRKAVRLASQLATAVCAHHRVRRGERPVAPASDLGHAANFLYMLTGTRPGGAATKAFDASLTLYAEHEMNASTRPARCRFMTARTARVHTKALVRFQRRIASHSSSVISPVGRIAPNPTALLTRTSARCQRASTASTIVRTAALDAASVWNASASTPASRRRLASPRHRRRRDRRAPDAHARARTPRRRRRRSRAPRR